MTKGSTTSLLWLFITFCSLLASRLSSFYFCHFPCFCPRWPLEFSAPSCYYDPFPSCYCSGDSHCFSSAVVAIAASAALGHQSFGPVSIQTADLLLLSLRVLAVPLLLPCCYCCCTFSAASFFSVTSSAPITRSRQKKTTQEANFCNGRRVVSQPIYQVTKLFAHITREWVFALIIANLAFRWRFVLYQLQHCLFSTCHSSPTKKNAPSSAFVGNGFEVIWSSLRIVIAKGLIQTEIVLAKCAPSGARAISCNLIQFFFSSKYPWSVGNSLCSFKSSLILWAFSSSQGNKETSIIGSHCPIP